MGKRWVKQDVIPENWLELEYAVSDGLNEISVTGHFRCDYGELGPLVADEKVQHGLGLVFYGRGELEQQVRRFLKYIYIYVYIYRRNTKDLCFRSTLLIFECKR